MTRTVVFDSGGLIAIERNDRRIVALVKAARETNATIIVPAAVVAEVWRAKNSQALLARFFKGVDAFPPLDFDTAKATGELIATVAPHASALDAAVAYAARRSAPALLVTSDPDDMKAILHDVPIEHVALFVI